MEDLDGLKEWYCCFILMKHHEYAHLTLHKIIDKECELISQGLLDPSEVTC